MCKSTSICIAITSKCEQLLLMLITWNYFHNFCKKFSLISFTERPLVEYCMRTQRERKIHAGALDYLLVLLSLRRVFRDLRKFVMQPPTIIIIHNTKSSWPRVCTHHNWIYIYVCVYVHHLEWNLNFGGWSSSPHSFGRLVSVDWKFFHKIKP